MSSSSSDEFSVQVLIKELLIYWHLFFAFVVLVLVFSVFYAKYIPDQYKAYALLAPAETSSGGVGGLAAGQLSGLAGLAGISLRTESSKTDLALKILQSRKFIAEFVAKHDLMVALMATKAWARDGNKLVIDPNLYDMDAGKWVRDVSPPRSVVPSIQEVYEEFSSRLSVVENSETGFIKLSFVHYSPELSAFIVGRLVQDLNEAVRQRDVEQANKSIEFLTLKLDETSVSGMREVFFQLIEEQTQRAMIAEVKSEYILQVIDPVQTPQFRDKPNRILIVLLGGILAILAVFMIVLFKVLVRETDSA